MRFSSATRLPTGTPITITKMIWFLGDSAIEAAVREFAGEEELIFSAEPNATPEEVWTRQIHDGNRRWYGPAKVVLYLPQQDYDSEATVWWILNKAPRGTTVRYLYHSNSPNVVAGLEHFEDFPVYGIEIQSLAQAHVVAKLRVA